MKPTQHIPVSTTAAKVSLVIVIVAMLAAGRLDAQVRVDHNRHTRLQRFARDMAYGTAEGLAFAGVDQTQDRPAEWGNGMSGYGKRVASNVGEFLIQEGVTEGVAAALQRPLDYTKCRCTATAARVGHALAGAVSDELPDGAHVFALPRFAGAYAGAFAQATWRPANNSSRALTVLENGTSSLALGAVINLFHEFVK